MMGAEVARGGRGVDGAGKTLLDEQRQAAGVVDVGVRKDDGVEGGGVEGKLPVTRGGLNAAALEHAAVEGDVFAGSFDQMKRTGDFARRARGR